MDNASSTGRNTDRDVVMTMPDQAPQTLTMKYKAFKGTEREYDNLHAWVRRELGRPKLCSMCGLSDPSRRYEWANKSHDYKRDLSDWVRVCIPCHRKLDDHKPNVGRRGGKHSRSVVITRYGYDPALIPLGHKRCSSCKEVKPHTEFYKKRTTTEYFISKCKQCNTRDSRKRYHAKRKRLGELL